MRYKGILEKKDDKWMVKWSDLHSFAHEVIRWRYTELSPESDSIKYINEQDIVSKPLEEGLDVDFELQTLGYDTESFVPTNIAKLVFPEVDEFEKEKWIREYVIKGNLLFSINEVSKIRDGNILSSISDLSTIRDGGTFILYNRGTKQKPLYIHKDNWTLHNDYPTTDENLVTDKSVQVYIKDRLERYEENCESKLNEIRTIIKKIKI
jgi:hypothetical protein